MSVEEQFLSVEALQPLVSRVGHTWWMRIDYR